MGIKRRASLTPVGLKLRLEAGQTVGFVHEPSGCRIQVPEGVTRRRGLGGGADVVVAFHDDKAALLGEVEALKEAVGYTGTLWIAYPKGGSGVATDLNRDMIWAALLPLGLRANFQIAIDDVWSALRFARDDSPSDR